MFHMTQSSNAGIEFAVGFSSEDSNEFHTTDYLSSSSGEPLSSSQGSPPLRSKHGSCSVQQDGESLKHVGVSTFVQSDGPCTSRAQDSFGSVSNSDTGTSAHLGNGSILPHVEKNPPKKGRRSKQTTPKRILLMSFPPNCHNHLECIANQHNHLECFLQTKDGSSFDIKTSAHLENGSILPEESLPKKAKRGRSCELPAPAKRITRSSPPANPYECEEYLQAREANTVTSAHLENDSVVLDLGECDPSRKKSKTNRCKQVANKTIEAGSTANHSNQPKRQESPLLNSTDDSRSQLLNGKSFDGVSPSPQSDADCSFYPQDSFSSVQSLDYSSSDSGTFIYFGNGLIVPDLEEYSPPTKKTEIESCPEQTTPSHSTLRVRTTGRSNHPRHAINVLKSWVAENVKIPYPSGKSKTELVNRSGLTLKQVSDWFTNERRRNLEKYKGGNRAMSMLNRKNMNKNKSSKENKENQDPRLASGSRSNDVPFMENDPCIASGSGLNPGQFSENSTGSLLVSSIEQGVTNITNNEQNILDIFCSISEWNEKRDNLPIKPEPRAEWIKKMIIMQHRAQ